MFAGPTGCCLPDDWITQHILVIAIVALTAHYNISVITHWLKLKRRWRLVAAAVWIWIGAGDDIRMCVRLGHCAIDIWTFICGAWDVWPKWLGCIMTVWSW